MKPIFKYIFVLLIIGTFGVSFAQKNYSVTGTLTDSVKHKNIFYATVAIVSADTNAEVLGYTFSDATGKFTIEKVPAGDYQLKVSIIGYDLLQKNISLSGNEGIVDIGELRMKPSSIMLQGISVEAKKPVYMMDGEKMLYNVSEDPTIQMGSASDALQNAPGVEVDVEGNVTLRGVSSVEIWLNNKPSNMNADALKQFIQQLPAGSIEKIEVITNPSARYSAQGSGGIINIITSSKIKKNSFLSFGVHAFSTPIVTPYISYVYSNEKFSISTYLNYSYWVSKGNEKYSATMLTDEKDTSSVYQTENQHKYHGHNGGLFLNGSYRIDSANSIYFWAGTYPSKGRTNMFNHTIQMEYLYNTGDYSYTHNTLNKYSSIGGYAGISYEHLFNNQGHKINADIGYWGNVNQSNQTELRDYVALNLMDRNITIFDKYIVQYIDASIDYTIPYHPNGEIEIGVAGDYSHSKMIVEKDTLVFGTNDFVRDAMRSKDAYSDEGEMDAYITLQHRFGNFTLKGGLRTEYNLFSLHYINSPSDNQKKGYWGLFPSIHLSYQTKNMHNFRLSYTRRVNNPSAKNLTTYISYGEDTYSTGNPDLKQSFTNAIEAGWNKYINKFGNIGISAYFRNSNREFSNLSDVAYNPFFDRIVAYTKPINAGKSLNTGGELSILYRLKSFMNIRFYANLYYMKSSFTFREEEKPYTVDNLGYSFRLNFWAKAWNFLEINASANYRSKSVSLFTTTKPQYSIDAGLRAEFWKRRITIHLDVTDIFNWNKTTVNSDNPYFITTSTSRNSWNSRSVRAGISFRFGKMELESHAQQNGNMQPMVPNM